METPLMGKAYRAKTKIGQVCARTSPRGQGSMEYLLLLGGAALIVLVVVVLIFNLEAGQETQGAASLNVFDQVVNRLTGRTPTPTFCGDGIIQTPNDSSFNEQCDEGNGGNDGSTPISPEVTCISEGFGTEGLLACNADCTYNTNSCGPK